MSRPQKETKSRFGIAEWYGRSFIDLDYVEKEEFLVVQGKGQSRSLQCPFTQEKCAKEGGVCSLIRYHSNGKETWIDPEDRTLRVTCPKRFNEGGKIFSWIGRTILGSENIQALSEISFLERIPLVSPDNTKDGEGVGRIDNIIVVPNSSPLQWCPVEIQAVYFSGDSMGREFANIQKYKGTWPTFPIGKRRPDYRSSGPKRLLPQLQIKVPTLRRWGKRLGVVIDRGFYNNMAIMELVPDQSNCDIVWFVVDFKYQDNTYKLIEGDFFYTRLETSVNALIAGTPVPQETFEERIKHKLSI